jgi:hypothetical protein
MANVNPRRQLCLVMLMPRPPPTGQFGLDFAKETLRANHRLPTKFASPAQLALHHKRSAIH